MDVQEQIQKLKGIEQSMQSYGIQKQNLRGQMLESQSALSELKKSEDAYRIVGSFMVKQRAEDLVLELEEKEASIKSRLEIVEKQETRLREEAQAIQKEIMAQMGENNGNV